MSKNMRKRAADRANVARRASLKTTPDYARGLLSLDSVALRKNVRTTLMFGTALGAGFMAMQLLGSETANAAINCVATGGNPAASVTATTNYIGDQPNGIHCILTPADPTIVVNTDGAGSIGGNTTSNAGDGSGIQIDASGDGSVSGVSVTVNNKDPIGNNGGFAAVTGSGIEVNLSDFNGVAGAKSHRHGRHQQHRRDRCHWHPGQPGGHLFENDNQRRSLRRDRHCCRKRGHHDHDHQ